MNTLENLINSLGLNNNQFAKKMNVTPQKLHAQTKSSKALFYAYQYALKLGIKELKGIENNCEIHLIIK